MPATLLDFALSNDQAAATTKKLQKQTILAEYLRTISSDEELRLAVTFASGRVFPTTSERVLGTSGAVVSEVLLELLPIDRAAFSALVVRSGEIGEAISSVWLEHRANVSSDPLTLIDLQSAFDDLASTGNFQRKKEIVRDLFLRCAQPREAAYLAKIIFSDLRTGVREGVLVHAIAEAFSREAANVQRAQLLVGDLGEVALLARHDRLASPTLRLFHPIQFMLATPQETADEAAKTLDGKTWFAEDKLDGIRAQVHKSADRIVMYTRTMDRTDESFPDVVAALKKIPGEFLLDGEIVPYRDGVVLPFAHIQRRLGRKVLTPKILRENPARFIAFDILHLNGELLMDLPLEIRRQRLSQLASCCADALPTTAITPVTSADDINNAFCRARECRNEGLMLKDPTSVYSPGRRGKWWLKLKTHLPTIDCVVTAAEYGHGKRKNSLSDYTFAIWDREPSEDGARLVNIGKAYSGVTDAEIAQLTEIFHKLSIRQIGHVHIVEPKIVLEIACDQIQESNRHDSGYALRFPRIKRIRWDKGPQDAERLRRIGEIYESESNTARGGQIQTEHQPEPTLFDGLVPSPGTPGEG